MFLFHTVPRSILHHLAPIALLLCLLVSRTHAQTEAADYSRIGHAAFLTSVAGDYQCVGINPANLGFLPRTDIYVLGSPLGGGVERRKRAWSFTIGEGGFTAHSDALARGDLWDALFQNTGKQFTRADQLRAAEAFADNGVRFSVDVLSLGAAYQSDHYGGIAVTIRERIAGTFVFNDAASKLAFQGRYFDYFDSVGVNFAGDTVGYARSPQRYSQLFGGTRLGMTWYRELGLSYGLQLLDMHAFKLYGGASFKYLTGYAYLDAEIRNGQLVAKSALSPLFGINYGKATSPSLLPGNAFDAVGDGWGLDLGLTAEIGEHLAVSASVIDLGAMRWDGNVFLAKDTILNGMSSEGFASYNIFEEAPKITGEGKFFKWDGLESATSELASRLRIGVAWFHTYKWRFGADAIFPLNRAAGSLGEPIISAGADWRPYIWLRLGTGIGGGGNMGMFIPVSVMFSVFDGMLEFGLSSRDLVTLVTTQRPVLSLAFGVARVRL